MDAKGVNDLTPFLEATKSAAQRSRTVAYVLILLTVFNLCAARDFIWPDWNSKRVELMTETDACFRTRDPSTRCADLTKLYKSFDYALIDATGKYLDANDRRVGNFENRLTESIKYEINHVSFAIPVFGPALDGNDLWIVSGPVTLLVFLLFLAYLEKEFDVLEIARKYCTNSHDRELLLSSQVLSVMRAKTRFGRILRHGTFAFCYAIPSMLHIFIVQDYVREFQDTALLLTHDAIETYIEVALAILTVPALIYVSWRCYRYGSLIERSVSDFTRSYP